MTRREDRLMLEQAAEDIRRFAPSLFDSLLGALALEAKTEADFLVKAPDGELQRQQGRARLALELVERIEKAKERITAFEQRTKSANKG